jgi:hypothetical protein
MAGYAHFSDIILYTALPGTRTERIKAEFKWNGPWTMCSPRATWDFTKRDKVAITRTSWNFFEAREIPPCLDTDLDKTEMLISHLILKNQSSTGNWERDRTDSSDVEQFYRKYFTEIQINLDHFQPYLLDLALTALARGGSLQW